VIGALAWVAVRRRFTARSGSFAAARFFFGVLMGLGALVFLGCPFRMLQRLGGGDWNAAVGALGFVAGVGAGHFFERRGYTLGKTSPVAAPVGLLGPGVLALLVVLFVAGVLMGPVAGDASGPPHAPWLASLGVAVVAGAALSATGFCAVSAARQVFQPGKKMLVAALLLIAGYAAVALATGRFHGGFDGQPAAHTDWTMNLASMALVGIAGVLAGGCPVRQMVMAGEGNGDAFVTVAGLVVGGAIAHNLGIVSSAEGVTVAGRWAVAVGLALSLAYASAITFRRPTA
jgi:YedE family putative selenium metabolism protein